MCLNTRRMAAAARAHPHSIIHTCNSSSTHSRLSRHCLRSLLLKRAEAAIRCQRLYSPPRLSCRRSAAAAAAASSASTRAAPPSPPLPCRCDGCRLRSPGHTRPSSPPPPPARRGSRVSRQPPDREAYCLRDVSKLQGHRHRHRHRRCFRDHYHRHPAAASTLLSPLSHAAATAAAAAATTTTTTMAEAGKSMRHIVRHHILQHGDRTRVFCKFARNTKTESE